MATDGLFLKEAKQLMLKKPDQSYDLTIVIPAYREALRIGKTLNELAGYIKTEPLLKTLSIEVIVVAADAPDKTHEVVAAKSKLFKNFTLLKPGPKVGKGRDVQYGMLRSGGDAIIFMDADLATPLRHLPTFYRSYLKGAKVAVGTRNLRKHHPNWIRRAISNGGNALFRFAGGIWIEDSQCGFKLFSYEACQVCFSRLTIMGWGFDMEVLAIAKANNFKIKTHRINDWVAVAEGNFDTGILANSIDSLKELGLIFRNRITRKYKA